MKRLIPLFAAVAFLLVPGQDAEAQMGVGFGPEVYYNTEIEEFGLGARMELSPALFPVGFVANGIYIFQDCGAIDCTLLEFGASGKYTFDFPGSPIGPYFGGGLTYQRISFDNGSSDDTGFHILAGIGLGTMLPVGAFIEGRYLIMDEDQFTISIGFLF